MAVLEVRHKDALVDGDLGFDPLGFGGAQRRVAWRGLGTLRVNDHGAVGRDGCLMCELKECAALFHVRQSTKHRTVGRYEHGQVEKIRVGSSRVWTTELGHNPQTELPRPS